MGCELLMANSLFISIIIPVYNGGENFKACIQSLKLYLPKSEHLVTEVIVVADGCTDGSDELAKKFGAQVISTASPGGPARARNLGAQQARGEIFFFIDADVTIHADTIEQVVELFTKEPTLSATIGSYDDAPAASNFLSQYKNLFHHYTHQTACETASTFWGACGAIRCEVFWAVGGFDESYRKPSIEDIELGYRLIQQGYTISLCKTLQVKHLKRWEAASLLRAEFFDRALPWTELLLREEKMINDLNLKFSTRLSVVLMATLLFALTMSVIQPHSLLLASIIALALFLLNWPVYLFFQRKRGTWFVLQMIPWHWLYFAYCGLAYGLGAAAYYLRRGKLSTQRCWH
jgi:glycosyltransferase involved in cell wall biosynthesis